jgi:DNA-directed RNA polymerase specialized sigma subunit
MKAAADPGAWSRGVLDRCDDHELVQKVQSLPGASAEREAACEALIVRYQPLVRSCALRYRESPEATEELMQAGYVAC